MELKTQKKSKIKLFNFGAVQSVALVLLVAIFTSTCLLPISEVKAADAVSTAAKIIVPTTAKGLKEAALATEKAGVKAVSKTGGKGAAILGGITSLASTAILATGIVAFVIILLDITQNFIGAAITMNADYYNLNNSFVNRGWVMIRDMCNLFFLLVLLFIAFCTILQIEKYNAKKNLLTLILMALLINFSKPIAVFIFDGSQLMMTWFLRDGANIPNNLGSISHIGNLFTNFVGGGQDLVAGVLIGIIFTFIYIVVLFCLGLFLFIRLVAIWLLVIVSPVAFFAMILPDFKKLSSQWWDALFRYSYVGPAIAFFLWLSSALSSQIARMKLNPNISATDPGSAFLNQQFFIPYIITIVFLFAALMMANQFGIQFSQAITKNAEKFMGWAAINALKWGERSFLMQPKIFGKPLPFSLSPRAWIKGWQEHSAEIDRRALEQASAQPRDFLSSVFRHGEKPKTFYRDVLFSKLEQEKMKEIESVTTESSYMIDVINKAKQNKSREAQAAASAALKILFKNNDQDDYMIDGKKLSHDPLRAKQEMLNDLKATGLSEQEVGKIFYQLGNIALPAGNMGYWGMSTYNRDTGQYQITSKDTQLGKIRAKAQTFETQQLAKVLHRNALMEESADKYYIDPKTGKQVYNKRVYPRVHEVGQVMAEILGENLAALEQFKGRGKVDTLLAAGGPASTSAWENVARSTLEASQRLANAANKLREAGQLQQSHQTMERARQMADKARIYLNFGGTAHAAYSQGKDAKPIQIYDSQWAAFRKGLENWKSQVDEEEVKKRAAAKKARDAGKDPDADK